MAVYMTYDEIADVQEFFKERPEELARYENLNCQSLKDAYIRGLLKNDEFNRFRLKLRIRELKKSIKELGKKIIESIKRVFWR